MLAPMINQELLKQYFAYDPDTGLFTRNVRRNKFAAGTIAGSPDRDGYICIKINGRHYFAHRLAWLYQTGCFPTEQLDHINHIRNDNRFENLRQVTSAENHHNRAANPNSNSGTIGVSGDIPSRTWRARISVNGRSVFLGHFQDKARAVKARKSAEKKYGYHPNHGTRPRVG